MAWRAATYGPRGDVPGHEVRRQAAAVCQKGADGNFAEYCCPPSTAGNGEFYFCRGSDNGYACIDKCRQAGKETGTGPWERCGNQGLCCHPSQECGQWTLRSGRKVYEGCLQKCRKIERRCGTVLGESCCPKDQVCCGDGVFRRCCELGDVCVRVQLDYGKYVKWCRPPCKVGEKRCRALCCKQTKVEILPSGFKQCECVR